MGISEITSDWSAQQTSHFLEYFGTSKTVDFNLFAHLLRGKKLKIIDIGMNGGYLVKKLLRKGHDAYGLDLPALAQRAREEMPEIADRLFNCNLEYQAIPGKDYDLALALGVVEHLATYMLFMRKVSSVIKPGGLLFLTTCCREAIEIEQFHTHHFTLVELMALGEDARLELINNFQTSPTNLICTFRRQ